MSRFCLMLILVLLTLPAVASVEETLWQQGNTYYREKQYDSAAACFERIMELQPAQAAVYYNAGNARYRLNQIGMAVLYYKRALKLDPDHKATADNLLLAESRISNHIQPMPELFFVSWWRAMTRPDRANLLGVLSLTLFLFLLGAIAWRRLGSPSWLRPQLIGGVAVLWAGCLCLAFAAAANRAHRDDAVVMEADAPMLGDPRQAKPQSYIPEGTTVKILRRQAGYSEVRLPDGRSGWMQEGYLTEI